MSCARVPAETTDFGRSKTRTRDPRLFIPKLCVSDSTWNLIVFSDVD
jgi:hypothetical protein